MFYTYGHKFSTIQYARAHENIAITNYVNSCIEINIRLNETNSFDILSNDLINTINQVKEKLKYFFEKYHFDNCTFSICSHIDEHFSYITFVASRNVNEEEIRFIKSCILKGINIENLSMFGGQGEYENDIF
jgi:hypothetical protein